MSTHDSEEQTFLEAAAALRASQSGEDEQSTRLNIYLSLVSTRFSRRIAVNFCGCLGAEETARTITNVHLEARLISRHQSTAKTARVSPHTPAT